MVPKSGPKKSIPENGPENGSQKSKSPRSRTHSCGRTTPQREIISQAEVKHIPKLGQRNRQLPFSATAPEQKNNCLSPIENA